MDGKECSRLLNLAPNVYHALKHGNAVVALESTIISHGMPYPQNLETAKEVELIVKQNGAIPATIAVLDGVPCIGLDDEQLERLAKLGSNARKTARRDIPHVIAAHENGATTVSATMFFASKVGIPVFVTGGIGGVHRHGEQTMDISSDLTELGRTPVAVISAGVKSILDIPKTLEYLETQGVTVAAYRTNDFPAFFTEFSGCQVPCRLDSPEECARLINANLNVRLGSGMLIAVPIPKEHAAYGHFIESAITRALKEANDKQVTGNAATPFLLSRVNELTGGASLAANIALVKNNAYVGAKIAVALAKLRRRDLKIAINTIQPSVHFQFISSSQGEQAMKTFTHVCALASVKLLLPYVPGIQKPQLAKLFAVVAKASGIESHLHGICTLATLQLLPKVP